MISRYLKDTAFAFLVGIFLGASALMVIAASATSPWGYYGPYSGYSYQNQASVSNDYSLSADTKVKNQSNGNVPTGYMGAVARLLKSGTLCKSSDWYYNSNPVSGISTSTPLSTSNKDCGSGTYSSLGSTSAYTTSGYKTYSTFESPNINH